MLRVALTGGIATGKSYVLDRFRRLDGSGELPLLSHLARHYQLENATLTTRGESPAGAGRQTPTRADPIPRIDLRAARSNGAQSFDPGVTLE